jgi:hypothetical protein
MIGRSITGSWKNSLLPKESLDSDRPDTRSHHERSRRIFNHKGVRKELAKEIAFVFSKYYGRMTLTLKAKMLNKYPY